MIRTALFSWRGPSPSYGPFLLWAGSVLYARRIFPRIVLVADKAGQGWLVDILKLPFDEVLDLPDWPAEVNHVYELPKLHAYAALCRRLQRDLGDIVARDFKMAVADEPLAGFSALGFHNHYLRPISR